MDDQWLSQLPIKGITKAIPVGGGDVNQAFRLETKDDTYFLLVQPNTKADFYAGEIAGLKAFEKADVLAPRVLETAKLTATLIWCLITWNLVLATKATLANWLRSCTSITVLMGNLALTCPMLATMRASTTVGQIHGASYSSTTVWTDSGTH